jgi:hypothetical protein
VYDAEGAQVEPLQDRQGQNFLASANLMWLDSHPFCIIIFAQSCSSVTLSTRHCTLFRKFVTISGRVGAQQEKEEPSLEEGSG